MIQVKKQSFLLLFIFAGLYGCASSTPGGTPTVSGSADSTTTTNTTNVVASSLPDINLKPYNRPRFAAGDSGSAVPGPVKISPSAASTQVPVQSSSNPVGQTGGTSDIKERATFNGRVYDENGITVDGANVTARSVDANVSWVGEAQVTTNGTYVFRNAPVGARVEITVTKDGWAPRTRTEVLKSNLQGDPQANVFDFGGTSGTRFSFGTTKVMGNIYGGDGKIINTATVILESLDPSLKWNKTISTVDGSYNLNEAPAGVLIRITVQANNKEKQREVTLSQNNNTVNFGGPAEADKPFAVAALDTAFQVATGVNPFVDTRLNNLSTFATDVDTASYTLMRNSVLNNDTLPDKKSVRIEEYLNFFDYNYPKPDRDKFSVNMEIAPSPFTSENKKLLRIGIQGKEIKIENRKDAILTFVVDTSGSMADGGKLDLVKESLKILLRQLKPTDLVGIVSYNSQAKVVLTHTEAAQENKISAAIDNLVTGASTNVETGLREGYKLAQQAYKAGAINRVILCSDGVSNTGISAPDKALALAKQASQAGINLSAIGFGFDNYNDEFMEKLAVSGDGYYAYVDNIKEALRIFVENATNTLQVIAKDAKIQVNFNPLIVSQFRLIGYENKVLANQDFRNNKINAGEIGPNHSVTALYELILQENPPDAKIADVTLRFKDVDDHNTALEINKAISLNEMKQSLMQSSQSFQLAAVVALYGEVLRQGFWVKDNKLEDVINYYRLFLEKGKEHPKKEKEFVSIVNKAIQLKNNKL